MRVTPHNGTVWEVLEGLLEEIQPIRGSVSLGMGFELLKSMLGPVFLSLSLPAAYMYSFFFWELGSHTKPRTSKQERERMKREI